MKSRNLPFVLAAGIAAALMSTLFSGVVLAHAPITSVQWDNPSNPTKVIATSGEDDISTKPGSFYLKVFDVQNNEVDLGDTKVSSDPSMMSVSVKPNLPSGGYRVDWMTVSADDGDEADDLPGGLPALTLLLNKPAAAPAPVVAPAPAVASAPAASAVVPAAPAPVATVPQAQARPLVVAPPATGDGGLLAGSRRSRGLVALAMLVMVTAGGSVFALARRRS